MAFNFFKWLTKKTARNPTEISLQICEEAFIDYALRKVAFETCVNLIAAAFNNCDFVTMIDGKAIKGDEYYLWNIEPNMNESSSVFINKLIHRLYYDNEAVVISTKKRITGEEMLVVADSFTAGDKYPAKRNEYKDLTVGTVTYNKTFYEDEVLHFVLSDGKVKSLVDMLDAAYERYINSYTAAATWQNGKHIKVHVDQIAGGEDQTDADGNKTSWEEAFAKSLKAKLKPFIENPNSVLPEFDGETYSEFGGGGSGIKPEDIKSLYDAIFDFTARALLIPPVLVRGEVADSKDATKRWLSVCIDSLAAQFDEEVTRKRYGKAEWKRGNYFHVDTSAIEHFDIFADSAAVEKLIGSLILSPDEVLEAAGRAPLNTEYSREHYLTKNIATANDALNSEGGENE